MVPASISITQNPTPTINVNPGTIACNGGTTNITVTAGGGPAPYTGEGTFTVTAGTHAYTITDANGCQASNSVNITEPSTPLVVTLTPTANPVCTGSNATIVVSATGGVSPYTGTGIRSAAPGAISLNVTDAAGCTVAGTTNVTVANCTTPRNDQLCNAKNLYVAASAYPMSGSTTVTCVPMAGSTMGASVFGDPAMSCGGADGGSVWYKFTTPSCMAAGNLSAFTMNYSTGNAGTNYDTKMALYQSSTNDCNGVLTELACNDNGTVSGCNGTASPTSSALNGAMLLANQLYYLRVDGSAGTQGSFELTMTVEPPAPTLTTAAMNSLTLGWGNYGQSTTHAQLRLASATSGSVIQWNVPGTSTTYSGLYSGTSYSVWSAYLCPAGDRQVSPIANYMTTGTACTAPSLTVNRLAAPNDVTATLTWSYDPSTTTTAHVYYRIQNTATSRVVWNANTLPGFTVSGNTATYAVPGLTTGATYEFWVVQYCNGGRFVSNTVVNPNGARMSQEADRFTFKYGNLEFLDMRISEMPVFIEPGIAGNHLVMDVSNGYLKFHAVGAETALDFALQPSLADHSTQLVVYNADETEGLIQVMDMQGRVMLDQPALGLQVGATYDLNVGTLAPGMYFVSIKTAKGLVTRKLTIAR